MHLFLLESHLVLSPTDLAMCPPMPPRVDSHSTDITVIRVNHLKVSCVNICHIVPQSHLLSHHGSAEVAKLHNKFITSLKLETHGTDNHRRMAENAYATVNFTGTPRRPFPAQLIRHRPELEFVSQLKGGPL